jgi:hypothetical protein
VKGVLKVKEDIHIYNITHQQMEIQIQNELLSILESIPVLDKVNVYRSNNSDYDIKASAKFGRAGELNILCVVKSKAEPQLIRNAALMMKERKEYLQKKSDKDFYCIIAAPYISERSGKICEEMDLGYIDLSGNCMLKYKSLYIRIKGNPNKYSERRGSKSIFERSSVKSSVILRNIFADPNKIWRIQELADISYASIGQVAKVKKFLMEREFIKERINGFSIIKPKEILAEWSKVYNTKPNTIFEYYSINSIPQIEQNLLRMKEDKGIECVLTGFAGGVRYAPTVRYNKIHVYVQLQDFEEVILFLGCKEVTSGSNISIIIPYDLCVLIDTRNIKNSLVASPVQVYLDLMGLRGRGEEAAAAVLDKGILTSER